MRKRLVLGLLLVVGACRSPSLRNVGKDGAVPAFDGGAAPADAKSDSRLDSAIDLATVDTATRDLATVDRAIASCEAPLPLHCGDRVNHSTLAQGRPDTWNTYGCTAQWMSGRETLYAFQSPASCKVAMRFKPTAPGLHLLQLQRCDAIACTNLSTMDSVFPVQADQPSYFVVDGYDGAEGGYSLEVDCECDQDGGAVDGPARDASRDTGPAMACSPVSASAMLSPLGIATTGEPKVLDVDLPADLATDPNWGLKAIVCAQDGFDLARAAGKRVCLIGQDILQRCEGSPATAWVVLNDGAMACVYKTAREGYGPTPGIYSALDPRCALPTIAPGATVSCQGQSCTSDLGPCCPTTLLMSRPPMCGPATCPVPIACDGPDDCRAGEVCCSLESASGFAGTSCLASSECPSPSRLVCRQPSDCPPSQTCGPPDPAPMSISPTSPAADLPWDVDFQVCAP